MWLAKFLAMDLNTVTKFITLSELKALPAWRSGDAWLAGGTWLFSEPQPTLRRLIDLSALGWPPISESAEGLEIAATCTIAELAAFAGSSPLPAATLAFQCCRSLLGSFKVWNAATVGGNVCMALPAGPMIAFATALDAEAVVWTDGECGAERRCAIPDLVTGPCTTSLRRGDILRAIIVPAPALHWRTAFRRISLNPVGRSGALVVGTRDMASGAFALTVTAAIPRPLRIAFPDVPDAPSLRRALDDATAPTGFYDDVHGRPDWRRHVTRLLAEEVRAEFGTAA